MPINSWSLSCLHSHLNIIDFHLLLCLSVCQELACPSLCATWRSGGREGARWRRGRRWRCWWGKGWGDRGGWLRYKFTLSRKQYVTEHSLFFSRQISSLVDNTIIWPQVRLFILIWPSTPTKLFKIVKRRNIHLAFFNQSN